MLTGVQVMEKDLVYDVGLHKGEDTEYYLKKGFRVIAIEANPQLISECKARFREAIALYRALGFRVCAPHTDFPANIMPYVVAMERSLSGDHEGAPTA